MSALFNRKPGREAYRNRRQEECGGFAELSSTEVAPIFVRVTGLPNEGFTEIRSGWWARPAGNDVFHILHFLRNRRGLDYRFRWGVSLPWVPRVKRDRFHWHRTLKAAAFDLWEQPYDYLISTKTPWQEADVYFPDRSQGETCFAQDLATCWDRLRPVIEEWWAEAAVPGAVLARAKEQAERVWEGPRHAPDPQLVLAFTHAQVDSLEEARACLQKAHEYAAAGPRLQQALEQIAREGAT